MKKLASLFSFTLIASLCLAAYSPPPSTENPALIHLLNWGTDQIVFENDEALSLVCHDGDPLFVRVLYPMGTPYLKLDSYEVFDADGRKVDILYDKEDGWIEQDLIGWWCSFNVKAEHRGRYNLVLKMHWTPTNLPEVTVVQLKVAP